MSSERLEGRDSLQLLPPQGEVSGRIWLPGSKSYTNRALIAAALSPGRSRLLGVSLSSDSEAMIRGLQSLGVSIAQEGSTLTVKGIESLVGPKGVSIDVGPAGTAMRFLAGFAAVLEGAEVVLSGSERMHERPIADLVQALRQLGVEVEYLGRDGCPPLLIRGGVKREGGVVSISGSISSQFISALLLIGAALPQGITLRVIGRLVSRSYVEMTVECLRSFGIEVEQSNGGEFRVLPQRGKVERVYRVPGDASGASYLWGMAALSRGEVAALNISLDSPQGDAAFPTLLEQMGCETSSGVEGDVPWVAVRGREPLKAIIADMSLMPDTAQTLAVVTACAEGRSELSGLGTLVHKETDRVNALVAELGKVGITAEVTTEGNLVIKGGAPKGARIRTYQDHRMAMSFAMLATRCSGVVIEDPEVVQKSFPDFWSVISQLGIGVT